MSAASKAGRDWWDECWDYACDGRRFAVHGLRMVASFQPQVGSLRGEGGLKLDEAAEGHGRNHH